MAKKTSKDFTEIMVAEWGPQVVFGLDIRNEDNKAISTNSFKLDWALTKPFVEGTINEIYGEEGTGKTTMALELASSATQMGKMVFYFDLERKLVKAQIDMMPRLKRDLFWRIRPDNGTDAVNKVLRCVTEAPGCVVIFDSLSQLLPEVEDAEDAAQKQMGEIARLAAKMVRKIVGPVERNKCTVIFISHITTNMNPYASGDTTKGGKAVRDIAAQRVRLSKRIADMIKDANGNIIGQMTICKVIKNNQGVPYREVTVPIMYGKGIDRHLDIIQMARDVGVLEYSTGWYKYIWDDCPEGKNKREAEMVEILKTNAEYAKKIITQVMDVIG